MMTPIPLKLGLPAEFASVRGFFRDAGFTDTALCRAFGMEDMSDMGRVGWEKADLSSCGEALRWNINIFLRGMLVPEPECRRICGDTVLAAMLALGLLRPARKVSGTLLCPVWLYPADGLVLISDRREDPDGGAYTPPEDVVFPAIYAGTLRFLKLLPETRVEDALDLCGGSGIGALHLARTARSAVTADITERSAWFADFNARLNGASVVSACGDLYEPVAGRQFDVISAHPPFVPATGQNMVYRDGGETGEEVTRRVIEGLREHLRPGGTCVVLCVARDTQEQPLEKRVCEWLGSGGGGFDVIFGLQKVLSVDEVVESVGKRMQKISVEEARELRSRLQSLSTRQFVYGGIVIRRLHAPAQIEPLRVKLNPEGTAADFDRLFAWREYSRKPGFKAWLPSARPRLVPHLDLTIRHLVQEGQLIPAEFVFMVDRGLPAALRPDGFVVPLIARLDGKRSVAEVFEAAQVADELPAGFPIETFTALVGNMIGRGFLEVEMPR